MVKDKLNILMECCQNVKTSPVGLEGFIKVSMHVILIIDLSPKWQPKIQID